MWYLEEEDEEENVVPEDDAVVNEADVDAEEDEDVPVSEGTGQQPKNRNGNRTNSKSEKSDNTAPTEQSQAAVDDLNKKKEQSGNGGEAENKSDKSSGKEGANNGGGDNTPPKSETSNIPNNAPNQTPKPNTSGKGDIITSGLSGLQQDGVKGAGKEVAKEVAKQEIKKQMAKAGIDVALKSAASALAPILFWIAVVVVLIIIVVGILMFFIAMPGQIVSKARSLASNVMKAWAAMIEGEDQLVSTVQLADVANYVESMGYDLKGEGFVTYDKKASDIDTTINDITSIFSEGYDDSSDLKDMSADDLEDLLYVDEIQGVIRRNDTKDVVDLNSESILSYIISDNQCYIIKNFNTSLDEMTEGNGSLVASIIAGIAIAIGAIVVFLTPVGWIGSLIAGVVAAAGVAGGSYLAVKMNNNPDYGKGLITIWHEGSRIGVVDGFYEVSEKGDIALDASTKTLYITRGWSNGTYTFDIDGWSGRYGMPLEFLLSVHLATQMPELAVEMATSFETEVEVILHEVTGSVTAGVLKQNSDGSWHSGLDDDDFITYETISELGQEEQSLGQSIWEGIKDFANNTAGFFTGEKPWTEEELEELGINARVLCTLFDDGMPHSTSCDCCSHIPGSQNDDDDEECSSDKAIYKDNGKIDNDHYIDDDCEERAVKIIAALAVTNDRDAESYTPYISKVTDHWFRDVYFVMNERVSDNQASEIQDVVKVDEDYFYETGERWTMYETWEDGDFIPEGFQVGDYKLYEEGSSTPSTKTKAEIQEINEKIALGDTSLTRLTKKAITQSLNGGSEWSAYELTPDDNELDWEKMNTNENSKDELKDKAVYKDENSGVAEDIIIYYKEIRPDDIKQVEDGQRTVTNSKIKNMFLNNKYYKYDGSVERADAIIADKSRADNKAENYNTSNDNRDEKLIAKVDINKDSLGAFSILENTHTLDADFIYRDFKELIVELNYFDKEDLSDKIETVMQWVIPECGSAGWPIRKYEKGENFYGTLINSKIDLAYMKKKDIEDAEITLEQLQNEVESAETSGSTSGVATGSVAEMVTKGYEIHKIMEDKGYDYCVLRPGDGCDHSRFGHSCALKQSIEEAESSNNTRNTCCATYVSWVLNEMGFGFVSHGAKNTYDWCKDNGWTAITDYSSLQPGDLLFNKAGYSGSDVSNIGHVQMLGNNGEWLNAGSTNSINKAPSAYDANFIIGMRSTLNGAAAEFEGYDPEQAVVAPVTGKVVDYGTVKRENIETGKEEEVGYIKIQALDHYITIRKGGYVKDTVLGCTDVDDEYNPENTYDPNKQEGYDYFYEEYKGVIDGCVLYIEGFDLTIDETLANADFSSEDVTRYEPNEVYNMTDNLKEAQALWREDAKTAAAPYFKDGEDIYIKEGTVIGKTYEDTEFEEDAKGNGNYIRLILRDLEDSIMEDVETYFDIPESYAFNGSVGNIQNIESADPTLMSLIEQLAGPLEGQYPGIVNMLKAISMNESGGGTNPAAGDDPMQAVESTGGNAGDSIGGWENSVKAAINALTDAWDKARDYGINDLRVVIQAYNYGSGFVDYTHNKGVNAYSKSLAEQFSDEQAAKLGWSGYGDKNYVDPKIYNYLPDLNV